MRVSKPSHYTVGADHQGMTVIFIVKAETFIEAVQEAKRQAGNSRMESIRIDFVRPAGGKPRPSMGERANPGSGRNKTPEQCGNGLQD